MIKSPVVKDYIKVRFYDGNVGVKTEICQKVLLQVYVSELNIDMQKNMMNYLCP